MRIREELAWVAGFFDGEGHVGMDTHSGNVEASAAQVHRAVLDRCAAFTGLGGVRGPYSQSRRPEQRPNWVWQVSSFEEAQALMALMWGFLGPVKQEQWATALERWKLLPRKRIAPGVCARCGSTNWTWMSNGPGHRAKRCWSDKCIEVRRKHVASSRARKRAVA